MKNIVLEYLKSTKDYVSGEEMSKSLNVSRTSVWKSINKLKELGYNIESSSKKGYKLLEGFDVITSEEISPLLNRRHINWNIEFHREIGSTNDEVALLAKEGRGEGLVVLCDNQTKGRGRLSRVWEDSAGQNIAMSILLRPNIPPFMAPGITQIVALSAAEGLYEATGLEFSIKWPNDIILNGKKVCGILTEMDGEMDKLNYIIVGMGINVNQSSLSSEIDHKATSIFIEKEVETQRKKIIASILNSFEINYEKFKVSGISAFVNELKSSSALIGKIVNISNPFKTYTAKVIDIDNEGYLVVEDESGKIQSVVGGDISIRGKESYLPQ
ncbi:MAG: biotin--[acetyl-CoA-carboxylase] ligase [Clostridium sp.]|uniref:biotin--[acetyl-CoA-carboxylase] ligase n=1 Tax=Clostridium sp. TaxID=1506 RepID=UPI002FC5C499